MQHSRQAYGRFLKGKRVAIVGPAPSIVGSKQAKALEAFDVIVRLNKALPVPDELHSDIGKRTDVLYNCMNPSEECGGKIDINQLHRQHVKFLVSPYAPYQSYRFQRDIKSFEETNRRHAKPIPFCHIDPTYFARLMQIIKLPNTGISAILDLLQHDIAHLYITGFTFFKGGYIKQYRGYDERKVLNFMAKYNLHDQERQLHYMRRILKNNPRVTMDKALADIINSRTNISFKVDPGIVRKATVQTPSTRKTPVTTVVSKAVKPSKTTVAAKPSKTGTVTGKNRKPTSSVKPRIVSVQTPAAPTESGMKKIPIGKPKISRGRRRTLKKS